jgi:hypothetical protein
VLRLTFARTLECEARAALAIVAAIGVGADEKKWFAGTKEEVRRAVRGTLHCTRIEVE